MNTKISAFSAANVQAGDQAVIARAGNNYRVDIHADTTTRLAAFAGNTNITSVGTITVGTWNGGVIPIAYGGTAATDAGGARNNLGIGNVENTALSTWAGTTNIVTLGTITAGTWNGGNISAPSGTFSGISTSGLRINLASSASGDLYYRGANGFVSRLGVGTDGQALVVNGVNLGWGSVASNDKLSITGGTLSGTILFSPDATYNIGAVAANRPANIYGINFYGQTGEYSSLSTSGLRVNLSGGASGDLFYRGSNGFVSRLGIGNEGQSLLVTNGNLGWGTVAGSGGTGVTSWGSIIGTLSSQTDLSAALALKQSKLTLSSIVGVTALTSNYEYTGVLSPTAFTLPAGSDQDYIVFRGLTTGSTAITFPAATVRLVGSSGYVTGVTFASGNHEFSLAKVAAGWFLADSSYSVTGTSGGGTWGTIAGNLPDQSDLQTALNLKVSFTGIETLTNKTLGTGTVVTLATNATGDMWYRGTAGALTRIAPGTSGHILYTAGTGLAPYWAVAPSGGTGSYQPLDATLTSWAATTITADKLYYGTGTDAFGSIDFPAAGQSLVAAASASAQRVVMDAAALATANSFTAANNFTSAPSVTRSQANPSLFTGNGSLTVGQYVYDTITGSRSVVFDGTPVEGSMIGLKLNVTGAPVLTIPTSKRFGETNTGITTIGLYPGVHNLLWTRINSEWVLSDTVGVYNNNTGTSAPAVTNDSSQGYSIGSQWIDVNNDIVYNCTDNTTGVALWRQNVNAQASQTIYNKTLGTGTIIALGSDATGDMWYYGINNRVTRIGIGSTNQVLTSLGGVPTWSTPTAGGVTGVISVTGGGTNLTGYTSGDILYASAANVLSKLGIGSPGQALTVVGNQIAWGTVTGVGGSGLSDPGSNGILKRTALNTTAIATPGVDYYTTGTIRASIGMGINGTSVPTTGIKRYTTVPYNCTIVGWNIIGDQTAPSGTFEVWRTGQGINLPTVLGTLMPTNKPTLTTGNAVRSSNVAGWTTTLNSGDILGFALNSVSAGYNWEFQLEVLK